MDNMKIYEVVREVPEAAKKTIGGGKLKGFTDINPMWRIQKLTECFGAVGIGWYYTIDKQWTETGADGRIAAMTNISLYIKIDGEWSMPIIGTGGSMLCDLEKGALVTSDEAYKMALTDAISVAAKALGVGADVYWQGGRTKYSKDVSPDAPMPTYEDALAYKIPAGDHAGKTLKEVYREDRSYINWLGMNGTEYERVCIGIINAEIRKANDRKE